MRKSLRKHAVIAFATLCALGGSDLRLAIAQQEPQAQQAQQSQMDKALEIVSPDMKKDVKERIEKSLEDYHKRLPQLEPQIKQFMNTNKSRGSYKVGDKTYSGMPTRLPLLDTEGVSPEGRQDYTDKDVRVMLNPETFAECYEERQVFDPTYEKQCEARCGTGWRTLDRTCRRCVEGLGIADCTFNQYYVSEVYVPIYQSRTYPGRAMGSFDPKGDYLSGRDHRPELAYNAVRDRSYTDLKQKFTEAMTEYYGEAPNEKGIPDKEFFTHADYAGRDRDIGDDDLMDTQPLHTLVYMTNFNRQHSRGSRPPAAFNWVGYNHPLHPDAASRCWFNTLPDAQKLAVAHATYNKGHDDLTFALNHQKVPDEGGGRGKAYGKAMLDDGPNVKTMVAALDAEAARGGENMPQMLNKMLGQYIAMNRDYFGKGMEELGVEEAQHHKDYLYHSFFRLYHSRNFNQFQDPLYAAIASGFSFYTLNSLKNPAYKANQQPPNARPIMWSFFDARPGKSAYAGSERGIGPGQIYSADKIQIIYPTVDDGRKGSSCFRPESLASSEYVKPDGSIDKRVGSQDYWGFRRDLKTRLLEQGVDEAHLYKDEVRIAYWIKRVNCHCTKCAQPGGYGCSVLNNGDRPTDKFYGGSIDLTVEGVDPVLKPGGPFNGTRKMVPVAG